MSCYWFHNGINKPVNRWNTECHTANWITEDGGLCVVGQNWQHIEVLGYCCVILHHFWCILTFQRYTPSFNICEFVSCLSEHSLQRDMDFLLQCCLPLSLFSPCLTFIKCERGGCSERWRGAPSPGHWAFMVRAASDHSLKQLTFQTGNKESPSPSRTIKQC